MSDEQIAAALAQERRAATDKIPTEELVTTVRQTAYALHLYLETGYLEKVYENALKHRLEKKGIFVVAQVPLAVVDIEHGQLINFGSPKFEIVKRIYTKKQSQGENLP